MEHITFYNCFYLILYLITSAAVTLFIIYMIDKYGSKTLKNKKGNNPAIQIGLEDNVNDISLNNSIFMPMVTSKPINVSADTSSPPVLRTACFPSDAQYNLIVKVTEKRQIEINQVYTFTKERIFSSSDILEADILEAFDLQSEQKDQPRVLEDFCQKNALIPYSKEIAAAG